MPPKTPKSAELRPEIELQPHQQRIPDHIKDVHRLLLLHGLGSGKTISSIAGAEQLPGPVQVIVPAALRQNYRKELDKSLTPGSASRYRINSYTDVARGNVQAAPNLIMDEAHNLRNQGSKRTQQTLNLAEQARNVIALTATPVVNRPEDMASLMSMVTGKPITSDEFRQRYVGERDIKPGFLGWLRGVPYGKEPVLQNTDELKALLRGHIDYYQPDKPSVPLNREDVHVEMGKDQARLYRAMWNKLPYLMKLKLKYDMDLSEDELRKATGFLVGPRQVGLSTLPYLKNKDPMKAFQQSTKLQKAMELLQNDLGDKRTKALVFSNFIDAGLTPYAAALAKQNIPHAVFHGGLNDEQRKNLVENYNTGKTRVALLGPSGSEGLSFKGTQLVQLLDPYWNSVRGRQSEGRGVRYDSHWDLPKELQKVKIQRFISRLPPTMTQRLLRLVGHRDPESGRAADDYLDNMAKRKDRLNQQLLDLLKEVGTQH